jgi:hypothetical protein
MHIKPKIKPTGGLLGEWDITDYCLNFDEHGPLRHLNIHWDALVHFCKTLDSAQSDAKQGIARALSSVSPEDAETSFVLESELEVATLADETLVAATIFIVLCSFKEFALKELYRQLPDEESLPVKRVFKQIKKVFMRRGLWPNDHDSNERLSEKTYDSVRNNFAHGDWTALKKALPKLELHDEFCEVVGFLREILEHMRASGLRL